MKKGEEMKPEELRRIGKYAYQLKQAYGNLAILAPVEREEMNALLRRWCSENEVVLDGCGDDMEMWCNAENETQCPVYAYI